MNVTKLTNIKLLLMSLLISNFQIIEKSTLPSHWLSIDQDIAHLQAHDQEDLDVFLLADQKSFHLVKIDFWTKVAEFFIHSIKEARLARLREYTIKTHAIFKKFPWRYDTRCTEAFYTKGLAKWDIQVFDRSILNEKIQHILCKNLGKFRKKHEHGYALRLSEKIDLAKLQAELALKLGIKPQKNKKGVNKSIIYYDIQHKPIGIFKKEGDKNALKTSLSRKISSLFGFKQQEDFCRHDQTHAEIAASLADRFFSIGLIPLTRRVTLEGNSGSFMLWEHNMKEAAKFNFDHVPDSRELYLFQLMAVYDFLFGNLDRHSENWLVGVNETGRLERIAMIDNGNAFPEEHPSDSVRNYFGRSKMYNWKAHPWANYALQDKILEHLKGLSPSKIKKFIKELRHNLPKETQSFLSKPRCSNISARASLLYEVGLLRKADFTPSKLGKATSTPTINKLHAEILGEYLA